MANSVEHNIRINAVLVCVLLILICVGTLFYIFSLHTDMDRQKKGIEQSYQEFAQIDSLIHYVNQAQAEANLYASSKRIKHYNAYKETVVEIQQLTDSIKSRQKEYGEYEVYEEFFNELIDLLNRKSQVLSRLNALFGTQSPLQPISRALQAYEPEKPEETKVITTQVQDTVISASPRKNIWRRIANVFSPVTKQDTVVTISSVVDTIRTTQADSLQIVTELHDFTRQAQEEYTRQIASIADNVNRVMLADQEISMRISELLVSFYRNTLNARMHEVQEKERLLWRNNRISVTGGIVFLLLTMIFISLIISNATKGLKTRKALEEANRLTQQLMESRHRLLLSVSHDMKTPLNSILGYLELGQSGELSEKDLAAMRNSGKYMLALLENLLKYSALEQGTLRLDENDFNLFALYSDIVGMFFPLARQKDLSFRYDARFDDKLFLHSDLLKIKQIIINLLSNAVKYTPAGSVHFTIEYQQNSLSIEVDDTGVGIPRELQETIFTPFSRIRESSLMAEGTGLGLFVVKGLADLLKGEISLFSAPGKGTKIRVVLPVTEVAVQENSTQAVILLIDDDLSFLTMLHDMVKKLGHKAIVCPDITGFESQLSGLPGFDFVLTDMEMGSFTGQDILRRVREVNPEIPVHVMTGREDMDSVMAIEIGFTGYLHKPVTLDSLRSLICGRKNEEPGLTLLDDIFGEDKEVIRRILDIFIPETRNHTQILKEAVGKNDFMRAQALCHKMLPMFMQLGVTDVIPTLQKMDSLRTAGPEKFPEWKEEISGMIAHIDRLIGLLARQYPED